MKKLLCKIIFLSFAKVLIIGFILAFVSNTPQYSVFSQEILPNQNKSIKTIKNDAYQSLEDLTKILENNPRENDVEKAIQTIEQIENFIKIQSVKSRHIPKNTLEVLADYLDLKKSSSTLKPKYADNIFYADESQDFMPESVYPAIRALISADKDALPEIINVIKTENIDSVKGKNAVYVLKFCFRGDLQKAVDRLHSAAAETQSQEEKGNLLNVSQRILVQLYRN